MSRRTKILLFEEYCNISEGTQSDIKKYIKKNKSAVFSSVGSYKIEENDKFKFVEILSGDEETIVGFPISRFFKETKGD